MESVPLSGLPGPVAHHVAQTMLGKSAWEKWLRGSNYEAARHKDAGDFALESDDDQATKFDMCHEGQGRLSRLFPVASWARHLTCSSIRADVLTGLTIAVMMVPQGMSYANIAHLQYVYGIYSGCLPVFVYALFGSSKHLSIGPTSLSGLFMAAGLSDKLTRQDCPEWYDNPVNLQSATCPEAYASLAFLTAAVCGAMWVIASILRFGALFALIGRPVISGFASAAAIIIGLGQAKHLLGVTIKGHGAVATIVSLVQALPESQPWTVLLSSVCLLLLIGLKKVSPKLPPHCKQISALGPLFACILGTLVVAFSPSLQSGPSKVKIVGDVPGGIFPFSGGSLKLSYIPSVLRTAAQICVIGYLESLAAAQAVAGQHGYSIDAGQELLGLGMANLVGSMFSCFPVFGAISRTAVANNSGGKTQLAGLVTSLMVLCTMLFLTRLFYYLPMFVLASIVVSSVISLVAYDVAIRLFSVKKYDGVCWMLAFLGTLFFDSEIGIAIAVVMSLAEIIFESARPKVMMLWRIPGSIHYAGVEDDMAGTFVPNVVVVRITASLFFANVNFVVASIQDHITAFEKAQCPVSYVVLDMGPVVSLDSTASDVLRDLVTKLRRRNIHTVFASVAQRVLCTMQRAGLASFVGDDFFLPAVHQAVIFCVAHQHKVQSLQELGAGELLLIQRCMYDGAKHEIGISNQYCNSRTAVFIALTHTNDGIAELVMGVLKRQSLVMKTAMIEGLRHIYFVQQSHEAKLTSQQREDLLKELDVAISESTGSPGLDELKV